MTEQPQSPQPEDDGAPTSATPAGPESGPTPADRAAALVAERPEVAVGGAFAGGFLFAMILRRLAR